jgi:hypothetical protein
MKLVVHIAQDREGNMSGPGSSRSIVQRRNMIEGLNR